MSIHSWLSVCNDMLLPLWLAITRAWTNDFKTSAAPESLWVMTWMIPFFSTSKYFATYISNHRRRVQYSVGVRKLNRQHNIRAVELTDLLNSKVLQRAEAPICYNTKFFVSFIQKWDLLVVFSNYIRIKSWSWTS